MVDPRAFMSWATFNVHGVLALLVLLVAFGVCWRVWRWWDER